MKSRLFVYYFISYFFFSVIYVTGIIKETRYVYDGVVQQAEYDEACLQQQNPNRLPGEPISHLASRLHGYEKCLVKEELWGYKDCDFPTKQSRIEYCFGIKQFSPTRTMVLVLVSLTGLMYFKIRKQ